MGSPNFTDQGSSVNVIRAPQVAVRDDRIVLLKIRKEYDLRTRGKVTSL